MVGQVGLEWSISGISATPASVPPGNALSDAAIDPAGAAQSSATAQFTQAMASFAPSGSASDLTSPLAQAPASEASNTILQTTFHPQAIS